MTRGPASAARQNQSCEKLIYLSICLRAAEVDGGGIIVLSVRRIASRFVSHGYGGRISQPIFTVLSSLSKLF